EFVVAATEFVIEPGADQAGNIDQQVDAGAPRVLSRPASGIYVPTGVGAHPNCGVGGRVVDDVEAGSAYEVVVAPGVTQDVVATTAVQPVVAVASIKDVIVPAGADAGA